jgi:3-methyladenine DNA glycosylase AlkD
MPTSTIDDQVTYALAWLKKNATKATLDGMARYAIPSDHALGVAMKDIKALGKAIGLNHPLALALWDTGVYEARMLTSFVADPAQLSATQMDRWCKDFDNWAYCDALCFNLFDRTPHAWAKVDQWSSKKGEFEKRTAFALVWSLSVHDKQAPDSAFLHGLALVEREAGDDRNFVKKAISMALRAVGKRNAALHAAAMASANRLVAAAAPSAVWIGRETLAELKSASVASRLQSKAARPPKSTARKAN